VLRADHPPGGAWPPGLAWRPPRQGTGSRHRRLRVTETASEVIETERVPFTFQVIRRSVSTTAAVPVRAYPRHKAPVTAFVNGGWDDFTADVTWQQPTGKWVGEAEYAEDDYVCDPGQRCPGPRAFGAFCRAVYAPPQGFAAVKFDVGLDAATFYPCP
jgi:hypothetical protein